MGTRRNVVGFAVIALAAVIFATGCSEGGKPAAPAEKKATGAKAAETTKESAATAVADAGKPQTACPVMGDKINKAIYADHDGKRVYFCCAGCVNTFKKDPAKYVKKLEDAGVTLAKAPAAPKK